jgi:hypothetical protein
MGSATIYVVIALLLLPILAFILIYRSRKPEDIVKEYAGTDEDKSVFVKKIRKGRC